MRSFASKIFASALYGDHCRRYGHPIEKLSKWHRDIDGNKIVCWWIILSTVGPALSISVACELNNCSIWLSCFPNSNGLVFRDMQNTDIEVIALLQVTVLYTVSSPNRLPVSSCEVSSLQLSLIAEITCTSSSAIAERPRDPCSTLNCKPLKNAFVRRKSVDVSDFWRGGSFRSPILGGRGRHPPTTIVLQKTRMIALSCGIKILKVGSLD